MVVFGVGLGLVPIAIGMAFAIAYRGDILVSRHFTVRFD